MWVRLPVHLIHPRLISPPSPGLPPVLVEVELVGENAPARLLVDPVPVSWEEFPSVLRNKLKQRPPYWPVYVQGNPELTSLSQ